MSMARCDDCRCLIDTDDHPEACTDDGYLCEDCREEPWTLQDEQARRADAAADQDWIDARQA